MGLFKKSWCHSHQQNVNNFEKIAIWSVKYNYNEMYQVAFRMNEGTKFALIHNVASSFIIDYWWQLQLCTYSFLALFENKQQQMSSPFPLLDLFSDVLIITPISSSMTKETQRFLFEYS